MLERILHALEDVGLQASHLLIGAFATSWVVARQGKGSIWKGVVSVLAGAVGTALISPLVMHYLNITERSVEYSCVFLVGILAMNTINVLIEKTPVWIAKVGDMFIGKAGSFFDKKSE